MAKVWRTGVTKGAALGLKAITKPTRKPRKAAAIRAAKKGRAARRAATGTISAIATLSRVPIAMSREESSGAEPRTLRSNPTAEASQPPSDVTKVWGNSDRVRGRWSCAICSNINPACFPRCSRCKLYRVRQEEVIDRPTGKALASAITEALCAIETTTECAANTTICTAPATNCKAPATNRKAPVTNRKAPATNRKAPATDQLHYRIWGEYYTGRDVTVDRRFASTVEVWQVACINDRRETDLGPVYQVLWVHPDRTCRKLYQRSWEPRANLREDGFTEEVDLVDRWKDSSVPLFEDFWRDDQRAAELAGRPDLVTQQDIDQYVEDILVQYGRDLREGAAWLDVRGFLVRLRDGGRDIAYNAFVKNNYAIPGRRGARVLEEIKIKDGIYIVGAYNHRFIGHGAVLTVQGTKRLLYDLKEGKPISSAEGWINFYAFVRPFKIHK
ncbi:hypothetical protein PPTG_09106 [Phytophthora nicotianae INRA-310]|uniref:RanBP2-type domain-containing protein n=1 Tax=Phytophthora nicotianae (strain INRA-310) TaxID=761204 RepID=W2QIZ1_PHYN3|nr:hypothetical protein PPTG_09106 [Phytophthora nicotianae INRA-310]ETN12220.1 hypothetical protein PPTG_09106 [Phytophthora nicotianae INRA-310]